MKEKHMLMKGRTGKHSIATAPLTISEFILAKFVAEIMGGHLK